MVSTIQAALLHYQGHVQNTLKERAAAKGKEKASPENILQEERSNSHLLALQACLPHVQIMATAIISHWRHPVDTYLEPVNAIPLAYLLEAPIADDTTPYENPFTGQMVYPQTRFTPGPSWVIEQDGHRYNDEEVRVAVLRSELESLENHDPGAALPNTSRMESINGSSETQKSSIEDKEKRQHVDNPITDKSAGDPRSTSLNSSSVSARRVLKPKEHSTGSSVLLINESSTIANNQNSQARAIGKENSNQDSTGLPRKHGYPESDDSESATVKVPSCGSTTSQEIRAEVAQPAFSKENASARSTNLRKPKPKFSTDHSVLQNPKAELDKAGKQEKHAQLRENEEVIQTLRDSTDGWLDRGQIQSFTQEGPRSQMHTESLTSEPKATQQTDVMPEEQHVNWMVQTFADMAASYYQMHFEDSTLHQEKFFQQMDRAPEPWVAQFDADRATAVAIAGDVPQDFDAFKEMNTKHEVRLREEQQLASRLIEERERQDIDQQLAVIQKLRAQWDAESTKINEQAQYAQQLWDEERERTADVERSVVVAQSLQAEWQAQSSVTQEQEAYARQLWEEENAAEIQLARSRALAERLQAEWQATTGRDDEDEASDLHEVSPATLESIRNSVNTAPFGRPAVSASTQDTPSQSSQVVAESHESHVEAPWVKGQSRVNFAIPQTSGSTASATGVPHALHSLPVELQQRFLEAQKIQDAMNDQIERQNREWAMKQELHRQQEREERQREATRLHEQEEERRLEAERKLETQRRDAEAKAAQLKAQQRALEEARRKQETEAECIVCGDSIEKQRMAILSCRHAYCGPCISEGFHSALRSKKPFHCCRTRVAVNTVAIFLDPGFVAMYQAWMVEFETPNPLYCHERRCATFIPPANIAAEIGTCLACGARTCRLCRSAWHWGVCKGDREGEALLRTARQQQWQTCPRCKTIVERSDGCLHMTCTCGAEFCYNCGEYYPGCTGDCPRR